MTPRAPVPPMVPTGSTKRLLPLAVALLCATAASAQDGDQLDPEGAPPEPEVTAPGEEVATPDDDGQDAVVDEAPVEEELPPQPPLPAVDADWVGNRVDYVIRARLEGESKRLDASLRATWTNGSDRAAHDLWFHLYLNAFSNTRSSHLFQSRGRLRGHAVEDGWGWSDVERVVVTRSGQEPVDVTETFRYRQPDDGRREDRTVFSVDLPFGIEPGESVEVDVTWRSQLPRVRRRTGYKGDFLLVAQWFPKLGVFEGERGWNCHQFHMNSEFFSDYGAYEVHLDLPGIYKDKVFGSGRVELSRLADGDRVQVLFRAPSTNDQERVDQVGRRPVVHDFTWTGDPDYEVVPYKFRWSDWAKEFPAEVARAARAFGPEESLRLRDVDVSVLIHPERGEQADRHARATEAALFFYGLWFGGYPYEHVTVVDPAWGAGAAGGMEYPTLFTAGTSLFTEPEHHSPESVTIHEAGHQFWYGLVGNNEFEASWMDEGFNSYTDSEVLWRVYGPRRSWTEYLRTPAPGSGGTGYPLDGVKVVDLLSGSSKVGELATLRTVSFGVPFTDWRVKASAVKPYDLLGLWRDQPWFTFAPRVTDPRMSDRSGYLGRPDADRVDSYAWEYLDRRSYVVNSYSRPATVLRSLAPVIGYDAFLRGMRHYAKTWRYRHPYPDDFFETFQEGAGVDCDWYFRETLRGTGTVDWSVQVQQSKLAAVKGFVPSDEGEWVDASELEDSDEDLVEGELGDSWRVELTVRRRGTLRLPVKVRVAYEDGEVEDFLWSREDQAGVQWHSWDLSGTRKVVSAVVDPRDPDDPEAGYWLDGDLSNNEWYDERDRVTPLRWGERLLASFQNGLWWFVGLGG